MGIDFNAEDIFKMAEQIEKNGAEFYRNAAEGVSGSPNRDLLLEMADLEDQHEKTFAALRSELTEKEKESNVFDPDNDAVKYLKALADMRVFFEKTIDVTSMEAILKEAISAEKDSILFYQGMKQLVPKWLGNEKIDLIIKEEMDHIRNLTQKLSELKSPNKAHAYA